MFTDKELEHLGIEIIEKVEDETIIEIAGKISTKLLAAFPDSNFNYLEVYRTILSTPMFYANIPQKMSKVNYFYKNSTIYFLKDVDFNEIIEYIFHECIHRLQDHRDKKGNLTRMGICEINELSVKATALNEAAIQYVINKALKSEKKLVTVYDVTLQTSTEYYPLITNLIEQIVYLIGDKVLVDSTINSNEEFKIQLIDNFGETEFYNIEKAFDKILNAKNTILQMQIDNENIQIYEAEILKNIDIIKNTYIETQNLIFTSYFENLLKRVETLKEISTFRKKLYSYRSTIGTIQGYDFFNSYCMDLDMRARKIMEEVMNSTDLALSKENKWYKIMRKIKKLFINSQEEYNK